MFLWLCMINTIIHRFQTQKNKQNNKYDPVNRLKTPQQNMIIAKRQVCTISPHNRPNLLYPMSCSLSK